MRKLILFLLLISVLCNGKPSRRGRRRFLVSPMDTEITRISVAERHNNRHVEGFDIQEEQALRQIMGRETPISNRDLQDRSHFGILQTPQIPPHHHGIIVRTMEKQEIEGLDKVVAKPKNINSIGPAKPKISLLTMLNTPNKKIKSNSEPASCYGRGYGRRAPIYVIYVPASTTEAQIDE